MKRFTAILLISIFLTGCSLHSTSISTDPVQDTTEAYTHSIQDTASFLTETTVPPETLPTTVPETFPTEAPAVPKDADLVRVIDYIPEIRQELAYATENNFTGKQIYNFTDAYLRYGTVKKLALVCEELAQQGIGLMIWDGFRPVSAQAALWEICPDANYVSHPVTGNRAHCRGSAVDVTVVDLETGQPLPVPTEFDVFSTLADRDYSDCSQDAA